MKFIIDEPEDKEPKIKLKLEIDESKDKIYLIGINKDGLELYIMEFENGKFFRVKGVELDGLETDDEGKIVEDK